MFFVRRRRKVPPGSGPGGPAPESVAAEDHGQAQGASVPTEPGQAGILEGEGHG